MQSLQKRYGTICKEGINEIESYIKPKGLPNLALHIFAAK
jgi:hypothetical protein